MRKKVGLTYHLEEKAPPYRSALEAAGLDVIGITPSDPRTLEGLDGLCLSGGTDLDPSLYGQAPHPESQAPVRDRDALERALLREALDSDLPVLAICRGMQLFNVCHKGTLAQHIEHVDVHRVLASPHAHRIEVEPESELAAIVGSGGHDVNSRHHQAVLAVGEGLSVSATAPDGTIEALERRDRRFAIAVQWHPEDRVSFDPKDRQIFRAFAIACGA